MNILLMYGGKSCEHDISIVTAKQVLPNIDGKVFEIYVTKEGKWLLTENMPKPQDFAKEEKISKLKKVTLLPGENILYLNKGKKLKKLCDVDVAVLCFHGVNGEDGTVQGLLQLCNIPYTSCGVCASSVSMDKSLAKTFLKGIGAPIVDGVTVKKENMGQHVFERIEEELGYPVIVKPSNLGSSIGISIAKDSNALADALNVAFHFDNKVLVEKALKHFDDVNVSVFKKDGQIFTSLLEKPTTWHDFLSFDDKYKNGAKGMASTKRKFPYEHPQKDAISFWARTIYDELDCKGVVRIDFLVGKDGRFFVNEINTIPGSFAYYLWQDKFDFKQLVKMQIDEAIGSQKDREHLSFLYKSDVLKNKVGKK